GRPGLGTAVLAASPGRVFLAPYFGAPGTPQRLSLGRLGSRPTIVMYVKCCDVMRCSNAPRWGDGTSLAVASPQHLRLPPTGEEPPPWSRKTCRRPSRIRKRALSRHKRCCGSWS